MKGIEDILTKERVDTIIEVTRKSLNYAIPIAGAILFSDRVTDTLGTLRYNTGNVKYDDAIRAIMNSRMWSEDKSKAVSLLRKDGSSEFCKAIIDVANSSMWSNDKIETIQNMCNNDQ